FNPALSGSSSSLRAQTAMLQTALPNNYIQYFNVDHQFARRSREKKNGTLVYPLYFLTGGLSAINYSNQVTGVSPDYRFTEIRANFGFRFHSPYGAENAEIYNVNWFSATKRTSKWFVAGNLEVTNVDADIRDNNLLRNSNIDFNSGTNGFIINTPNAVGTQSGTTLGAGLLGFFSLKAPDYEIKPDRKPFAYFQTGYRATFTKIDENFIEFLPLNVIHADFHSIVNFWHAGNTIKRNLSFTLGYVRMWQGQDLIRHRGAFTLHYFNENDWGTDFGFEFTDGFASFILGFKAMFDGNLLSVDTSVGTVYDGTGIEVRGDNALSFRIALSYEFWSDWIVKNGQGNGPKSSRRGKSRSRAGSN
ncbi:MAG: hypothetical protein AAFO69_14245, partial [Bacteroidota bacterium]